MIKGRERKVLWSNSDPNFLIKLKSAFRIKTITDDAPAILLIVDEQGTLKTHVGRKGAIALEEHIKKQTDMKVKLTVAVKGMDVKQFTDLGCGEVIVEYTSEKPLQFTSGQRILEFIPL